MNPLDHIGAFSNGGLAALGLVGVGADQLPAVAVGMAIGVALMVVVE